MPAIVEAALLVLVVGACACASLGVLVMPTTYARLHYVGLVTTVGAAACVLAVTVAEGLWPAGAKALLVGIVVIATGPVIAHATARAARAQYEDGSTRREP